MKRATGCKQHLRNLLSPMLLAGVLLGLSATGAQASSQVVIANEGWLFPGWEPLDKVDNAGITRNIALFQTISKRLEQRHIKLVLMVVPMKAPLYQQYLKPEQKLSASVLGRYRSVQAELGKAGVASLDLEPILQKTGPSGHDAFWRADYHWTAWAAEDAAQGAADLLRQRYPLTGEPGGGTALGPWVQKRMFGDLAANLLPAAKRKLIGRDAYTVRQEVEKDLLIDDAPAPVHVIGNSFVQPFLGFPQRLSNILDRPVTLTWNPGDISPWATFMQYLESSDFAAQKPQVIIWQFNEGQLHLGPDASQWTARQPPSRSEWLQRLDKALQ